MVARYRDSVMQLHFRGDAAFANSEIYEFIEGEDMGYTIRLLANSVLQNRIGHLLKAPGRAKTARSAPLLRQLRLSGAWLEEAV